MVLGRAGTDAAMGDIGDGDANGDIGDGESMGEARMSCEMAEMDRE